MFLNHHVADAFEGVITKVASGMDPMEFLLVEVAVGICLEILFLFYLSDVIGSFYLLK